MAGVWLFYAFFISNLSAYVWKASGNGIIPHLNVPVRTVFIQIYEDDGETPVDARDLEEPDAVQVVFKYKNGNLCPVRKTQGVHWDGRIMFRYRINGDIHTDSQIEIWYRNQFQTQIEFKQSFFNENCHCPLPLEDFYKAYNCPETFDQLEEDFLPFLSGIDLRELWKAGNEKRWGTEATIHYVIYNQKVYTKRLGKITDFKMFVDGMVHSLLRKVKLPNMEFVFNVGDWPIEKNLDNPLPVFSWCGSGKTADIIFPTWDQTKNTRLALARVTTDITYVQQHTGAKKWKDKIPKALFRGRDSNEGRLKLAEWNKTEPLLDAGITSYNFRTINETKWGPKADFVPLSKMGDWKYNLLIDGTVAAYRAPYLFQHETVVLKQASEYYEWWYKSMKPGVHYVLLKKDLSDAMEKIKFVFENDRNARHIARAGSKKAQELLTTENMYCYYAKAFEKYAKLQKQKVKLYPASEHEQTRDPDGGESKCKCHLEYKDENPTREVHTEL